jgi:hypothetical protein
MSHYDFGKKGILAGRIGQSTDIATHRCYSDAWLGRVFQHLLIIGRIIVNLLTLVAPIQRVIEVVRASVEHATVNKNGGLLGECGRRSRDRCPPSGDLLGSTDRRSEIGSHINRSFSQEAAWYCIRGLRFNTEPVFIIEQKGG